LLRRVGAPRFRTVVFDVDSTLAAIEGIDWLAALRDADTRRECESLTTRAMAGEIPIEAVYAQRLTRIAPTATELQQLANAYIAKLEPGAPALVHDLVHAGVSVHLVSGGLRRALLPLAQVLGVSDTQVHAVELAADVDGALSRLDGVQPLATQRGKPQVIAELLAGGSIHAPVAMIGDGSTDAATRGVVDQFFAYTGVVARAAVVAKADAVISDFVDAYVLLFEPPAATLRG
jgi:HAD superfamily phosphoserine phosphatase-like hydrolase